MAAFHMKINGFVSLLEAGIAVLILTLMMALVVPSITWNREHYEVDILTRQLALDLQNIRQHSLANGGSKSDAWVLHIGEEMYYIKQNYTRQKERLYPGHAVIAPAGKEIYFHGTGKPEGTMSFTISSRDKTYTRNVIVASQTGRIRLE